MNDFKTLFPLALWLFCSLQSADSQPNCTNVKNLEACDGDTTDFCPKSITCACQDQKPFCQCQNSRGKWGELWYMGTKCEQVWSTLDLVLVTVLPGLALTLIVAVTMQTVYYCRNKKAHQSRGRNPQEQHNPAYLSDQPGQSLQMAYAKALRPTQSQLPVRSFSFMTQGATEEVSYSSPSYGQYGSRESFRPQTDYPARNPGPPRQLQPHAGFRSPGVPNPDYLQGERHPMAYPSAKSEQPFRVGRAQMAPLY
ncbi:uncharacterized protein LOC119929615 [Tachyglossus aculeatus]|uniref:uncharacterized protein LOC119929615 n=1 Tax=Tachyglossus aculeatus TaxID=9261 RepID=UPI0018F5846B|nr:uncharacterized protein LOC119929615 [Tachyglossus aculeatus]